MAYNNADEVRKELGQIKKDDRGNYIYITEIDNPKREVQYIDIRLYYTADDGEIRPTQKGVRFNAELLEDVIEALKNGLEGYEDEAVKYEGEDTGDGEDA